mgnify:CR=1 FL=1
MTKLEFMEGVNILQDNYNRKLTVNQLKLYYNNLKDMRKEKYLANINEIIKKNTFMPTIAEIRGTEQRKQFSDYQQRDYENIDFNKFYAN